MLSNANASLQTYIANCVTVRYYPADGGPPRDERVNLCDHSTITELLHLAEGEGVVQQAIRTWSTTEGSVSLCAVYAEAGMARNRGPNWYSGSYLPGDVIVFAYAEHVARALAAIRYFTFDYMLAMGASDTDTIFHSWGRLEVLRAAARQLPIRYEPQASSLLRMQQAQNWSRIQQLMQPAERDFLEVHVPDDQVENLVLRAASEGHTNVPFMFNPSL